VRRDILRVVLRDAGPEYLASGERFHQLGKHQAVLQFADGLDRVVLEDQAKPRGQRLRNGIGGEGEPRISPVGLPSENPAHDKTRARATARPAFPCKTWVLRYGARLQLFGPTTAPQNPLLPELEPITRIRCSS